MLGCRVGGDPVLLVNLGGRVLAYRDRCAHLGVALSEGRLVDGKIVCRAHGWEYDAASGSGTNPGNVALVSFAVRVENDAIFVDTGGGNPE